MLHKAIKGYEDYLISDTGQVYSLKSRKYLKPLKNKGGYYQVYLYKNRKRKTILIHRLVAQAFIDNPENKPEVDHVNRDRLDNRVENLRWATRNEQNYNRDLTNFAIKYRKACGVKIVEILENGQKNKYNALREVPNISPSILSKHINQGETDFYAKGRHFIVPQQK